MLLHRNHIRRSEKNSLVSGCFAIGLKFSIILVEGPQLCIPLDRINSEFVSLEMVSCFREKSLNIVDGGVEKHCNCPIRGGRNSKVQRRGQRFIFQGFLEMLRFVWQGATLNVDT